MEERIAIEYTGDKDAYLECGYYFSLTFSKEWFYSKDKKCYGIPFELKYMDGTGDANIDITLNDEYNDLSVFLYEYRDRYNGVIWLGNASMASLVTFEAKINISRNRYKIVIDFSNANLSESISFNFNSVHAQDCYDNLEIRELWKLWKEYICLDGICIDTALKNRLSSVDFIELDTEYTDTAAVYYVWPGTKSGNKQIQNGLEVRAEFKHEHAYKDKAGSDYYLDSLEIYATDKEHPCEAYNDTTHLKYEYIMDDVDWNEELTNLYIRFSTNDIKDIWVKRYLDIPVSYRGHYFILRIILNPYIFEYQQQPDHSLWVIKCTTRCFTDVSVPAFVGGQRVTRIGKKSFSWCTGMISARISEGIESIASFAFNQCIAMEKIEIPASIMSIGRHAFRGCTKLISVSFLGSLTEIRSYTFADCCSLSELLIPEGCEKIGYRAFWGSGLRRAVIPKSVKKLEKDSFKCRNLKVAIPSEFEYLLEEKAKRHWFGSGNNGPNEWIEEMDFSVACDIFERKTQFYGGTILCFYDSQYKVVKKTEVR